MNDSASNSCTRRDLVRGTSFWLLWGPPTSAVVLGAFLEPVVRATLWTPAFFLMGTACCVNAYRCGRLHCYMTAPLLLGAAIASLLAGLEVISLPWSWIGFGALGGTLLAYLPESVRGKYLRETWNTRSRTCP